MNESRGLGFWGTQFSCCPCVTQVEGDPVGPSLTGPSVRRCAIRCRCSSLRVDPEPPPAAARSGVVVTVRTQTTLLLLHEGARGLGSAKEPLDGGASTHRRAHASLRGPTVVPSLGELRRGAKGASALGFDEEKRAPVLFELKIRTTIGSR
jgi:hypothetical protein